VCACVRVLCVFLCVHVCACVCAFVRPKRALAALLCTALLMACVDVHVSVCRTPGNTMCVCAYVCV
jgi:hypothetical protein